MTRLIIALALFATPFTATLRAADAPATAPAAERPEIEIVFVLDTTGSMSGLIEGAKQKIWSIANAMISQKSKPHIKIGLVGYRDRGDEYITKVFDLTDDIDTVFKSLMAFKANGGGDEPESVNQALDEAVTKITWSDQKKTTRIIFLVGDAPPHMDYKDDVKYATSCALAGKKDIVVNAVQCGNITGTTPIWTEIARLGKGKFLTVPQEGGMIVIASPQDKELAELNAKMAGTAVAYGNRQQQAGTNEKIFANASAPATRPEMEFRLASRAAFNATDGKRAIQGKGDLVWDCGNGVVSLAKLTKDQLPPELAKLTPEQLAAYIAEKQKERDGIQVKIDALCKERDAYIAAERARLAKTKPADQFDERVTSLIVEQYEAKQK